MNPKKSKIVAGRVKKSPSTQAILSASTKASINGGVTIDSSANAENIREISRKLGYNILQDATFVYVPASYGEGKNFSQNTILNNKISYSEEFDNPYWVKAQATISPNTIISPIGNLTADKLIEDSTNNQHYIRTPGISVLPLGILTTSMYVKAGERNWFQIYYFDGITSNNNVVNFDVINGVVGTIGSGITSYSMINSGNGWYKCSITINNSNNTTSTFGYTLSNIGTSNIVTTYLGNGSSGLYIWGAQLETGTTATTYQHTGDGIVDFNFTRATSSTVLNKQGIVEDSCYNFVQYSEAFTNGVWINNGCVLTLNATSNPFGGPATKMVANNGSDLLQTNGIGGLQQYHVNIKTIPAFTTYIFSIYAKSAEITNIRFREFLINGMQALVDLTNGSISYPVGNSGYYSVSTISAPNNWWLINITRTTGASPEQVPYSFKQGGSVGNGVSGIYIWGAQVVQASTPKPYLRTTNRLNVPKLDYTRTLSEPSLLIEPQRTNLTIYSQDFTQSVWTKDTTTVIPNVAIAPDGTMTASKIICGTTGNRRIYQLPNAGVGNYSVSIYFKSAEITNVSFQISDNVTGGPSIGLDMSTGIYNIVTNSGIGTWTNLTGSVTYNSNNGWYKCTLNGTKNSGTQLLQHIFLGGSDGFSGMYMWGAQIEVGLNPTTYIPTTSVAVTRNTETSYVDLFNNNMLNQSGFTLYWEGFLYDGGQTNGFGAVALSDTSAANSTTNQVGWYYFMRPYFHSAGTGATSFNGAAPNSFNKFAIQYSAGTANYYANGINIYPNKSVPVFNYRYLVINSNTVGSTYSTDKIVLFNRTLTNAELTGLTYNPTINTGISAYYKLDGNTIDSSSNCPTGTATGIDYVSGKTGNAARFDSVTDRIDISDTDYLSFTDGVNDIPFSVSLWVYFTGFNSVGNWFINKRNTDINVGEWQIIYATAANRFLFQKFGTGVYQGIYSPVSTPTLNIWYNIVITDDGTKTNAGMNIYINSVLQTTTIINSGIYSGMSNTTTNVRIGQIASGTIDTTTTHQGYLEDIGIWKHRVLTQSEITNLYNSGSGRTYPF